MAKSAKVLFPLPDEPTKAIFFDLGTVSVAFSKAFFSL
jgi:hypothetical protein